VLSYLFYVQPKLINTKSITSDIPICSTLDRGQASPFRAACLGLLCPIIYSAQELFGVKVLKKY